MPDITHTFRHLALRALLLLLVCLLPVAASARKRHQAIEVTPQPLLTQEEQQWFDSLYVGAVTQELLSSPDSALSLMHEAVDYYREHIRLHGRNMSFQQHDLTLGLDTSTPDCVVPQEVPGLAAAFYFLSQQYRQRNDGPHALHYIQAAVAIDSVCYWYSEEEADLLMSMRQLPNAVASYERLARLHPNESEPLFALSDLYLRLDRVDDCLQMLDRVETLEGLNPQLAQHRFVILQEAGRLEEGFEAFRKLVNQHPYDVRYRIILGNLQMQNARIEQAKQTYDEAAAIDPDNAYVWVAQANFYSLTGNQAEADKLVANALMNANLDAETKNEVMTEYLKGTYRKLSAYRQQVAAGSVETPLDTLALFSSIDSLFVRVSAMHPSSPEFYELHAQWLDTQDKDSLASECLRFAIDLKPNHMPYWEQLLYLSPGWMPLPDLLKLGDEALQADSTLQMAYMVKAWAYMRLDQPDQAIAQYRLAIDHLTPPDANKISELWSNIGDIHYSAGDYEPAYECFEKAVTYNPQNYLALNNYAYYLSKEERDLPKAEAMSLKVIQQYPDNSTYLDTYAWILYLEGSYVLAEFYQQKAIDSIGPDDQNLYTLYDHFGDIKVKNNDLKGAVVMWRKALQCPDCEEPESIQKKVDSAEALLK